MSQKLIFFDIDGTLYNEEKQLPHSTINAIRELKEKGHYIAIATGRAPFLYQDLREELEIDTYVSFNGSYVVAENRVIDKKRLDNDTLMELIQFAKGKQHPLVFMDHEGMRSNIEYHPHIEESIGTLKWGHPAHDPNYFQSREIYQSLAFCTEEEEGEYVESFPQFEFVRWHPLSVDILPANGSKARGIEAVINHLGFSHKDVYAFGDGLNDIEMLQFVL